MIEEKDGLFRLTTDSTSYWFRATRFGHLEHLHYGERLSDQNPEGLALKRTAMYGSSVIYDETDPTYCLDTMALEWSGIGRGDYRHSPRRAQDAGRQLLHATSCTPATVFCRGMRRWRRCPCAYGDATDCDTLELRLKDGSQRRGAAAVLHRIFPGRM